MTTARSGRFGFLADVLAADIFADGQLDGALQEIGHMVAEGENRCVRLGVVPVLTTAIAAAIAVALPDRLGHCRLRLRLCRFGRGQDGCHRRRLLARRVIAFFVVLTLRAGTLRAGTIAMRRFTGGRITGGTIAATTIPPIGSLAA